MTNSDIEKRITVLENKVSEIEKKISEEDSTKWKVSKSLSIKEFLLEKKPKNDVQKTLIIAYYIEKYKNIESFSINDIKDYLKLAKESIPINLNDKINLNIKKGFMIETGEKKGKIKNWTLTRTGLKFIENKPNINE